MPLTPSLYVPGKLASADSVLVDIGTGFYVEKKPDAAQTFYKNKVEELGKNLTELEKLVQGKQGNLGAVEDGLCYSMLVISNVLTLAWQSCVKRSYKIVANRVRVADSIEARYDIEKNATTTRNAEASYKGMLYLPIALSRLLQPNHADCKGCCKLSCTIH